MGIISAQVVVETRESELSAKSNKLRTAAWGTRQGKAEKRSPRQSKKG